LVFGESLDRERERREGYKGNGKGKEGLGLLFMAGRAVEIYKKEWISRNLALLSGKIKQEMSGHE